jgi:uncharacterized OsmC-like protein
MTTQDIARAVDAAVTYLRAHPDEARGTDRPATVVVEDGLRCRATDSVDHAIVTDMPGAVGGTDAGPTPGTLLRMAVGSCAASTIVMRAAQEGIQLAHLEVTVSSESDDRGMFGIGDVPPGPLQMHVRYRLSAPGVPADRLHALIDWAERYSPVAGALRDGVPRTVDVDTT